MMECKSQPFTKKSSVIAVDDKFPSGAFGYRIQTGQMNTFNRGQDFLSKHLEVDQKEKWISVWINVFDNGQTLDKSEVCKNCDLYIIDTVEIEGKILEIIDQTETNRSQARIVTIRHPSVPS